MPNNNQLPAKTNRVLVKLRPSNALRAAESRVNLRPLYDTSRTAATVFGVGAEPQWFIAELPDGAEIPWDLAHERLADQLGVAESDVVFAEPDLGNSIYPDPDETPTSQLFLTDDDCTALPQDKKNGKATGPDDEFPWHLGDDYTQLAKARDAVQFNKPLTRIAHVDTGYDSKHPVMPKNVLQRLERNFVEGDANRNSAEDPDNWLPLLDGSGHGTGTLGILAGGKVSALAAGQLPPEGKEDSYLGGAPDAEVLPLRIADSVVLLLTSALARALDYAVEQRCDVLTLSMGGLPSKVWEEAVDKAYEAGLCICAAAGNHLGSTPRLTLVYPARYPRVIAVCGVMANGKPYADLQGGAMEGCFGPDSAMKAAIAAYTPNIPWARFHCERSIRLNGEGTSAATPQVAAAVALWFEKYKNELPRDLRRVEAVRHALFTTAKGDDPTHFGNGILQAHAALEVRPNLKLPMSKPSDSSWAFLRIITGLGIVEIPPRELMFNLELAQLWLMDEDLQKIVPDPSAISQLKKDDQKLFMDAVIGCEKASLALRRHIATRYPVVAGSPAPYNDKSKSIVPEVLPASRVQPALQNPPYRRLRVYAMDPSFSTQFDTAGINEVTLKIRWEQLDKGPVGEYLDVKDVGPDVDNKKRPYEPVDLNDPRLLAQDGWAPSEGNPQFHQQMVYAVAMKTIEHFEHALGRPIFWRRGDIEAERKLIVRPHFLWQANAFYSPEDIALNFGYFQAAGDNAGDNVPGSLVYTCLSHDVIAHETTHAILDGMYQRFNEPTNPDVLALHEAFADIVALMQHFTIPEVLENEISRTRGNFEAEASMLGSLAVQFGYAMGGRGALRNAIGSMVNGVWKRFEPNPSDLQKRLTPHARGAILVAAVFDAFIAIYKTRIADLLRIYTAGTGVLPNGAIHPDLVRRLASEAAKSANHVLTMCIRALDYLPPVDVTFFEFLRAVITADLDLVSDDRYNYRIAFVEAFRRRGIYSMNLNAPESDSLRTLSVDTLRWQEGHDQSIFSPKDPKDREQINKKYKAIKRELKNFADSCFHLKDRKELIKVFESRKWRTVLHDKFEVAFKAGGEAGAKFASDLGIDLTEEEFDERGEKRVKERGFEVHIHLAMRISPDGKYLPQVVVALTQNRKIQEDKKSTPPTPSYYFYNGSTLIVDLATLEIKYRIVKKNKDDRKERTADFVRQIAANPLRALFIAPNQGDEFFNSNDVGEPFAVLHALDEDGF